MHIIKTYDNFKKENIKKALEEGRISSNNRRFILIYLYMIVDSNSLMMVNDYGCELNNILDSINLFTVYSKVSLEKWDYAFERELLESQFAEASDGDEYERILLMKEIGNSFGIKDDEYPILIIYDTVTNKCYKRTIYGNPSSKYKLLSRYINEIKENRFITGNNPFCIFKGIDDNMIYSYEYDLEDVMFEKEDFFMVYEEFKKRKRGAISRIIEDLGIGERTYRDRFSSANFYQLFERDAIIIMSIEFECTAKESNRLLKAYDMPILSMDDRDSIIRNCLERHLSFKETNNILSKANMYILSGEKRRYYE